MYVANELRDLILKGKLKPRMRLKIDEVAELLKTTHMLVRVALKDLEAEGGRHRRPRGCRQGGDNLSLRRGVRCGCMRMSRKYGLDDHARQVRVEQRIPRPRRAELVAIHDDVACLSRNSHRLSCDRRPLACGDQDQEYEDRRHQRERRNDDGRITEGNDRQQPDQHTVDEEQHLGGAGAVRRFLEHPAEHRHVIDHFRNHCFQAFLSGRARSPL